MKWTKKAGMTAIFVLCVMINVLFSGCGGKPASGTGDGSEEISESTADTTDLSGTEASSDTSAISVQAREGEDDDAGGFTGQ